MNSHTLWTAAMILVSLLALTIVTQYSAILAVAVWFVLTIVLLFFRPE